MVQFHGRRSNLMQEHLETRSPANKPPKVFVNTIPESGSVFIQNRLQAITVCERLVFSRSPPQSRAIFRDFGVALTPEIMLHKNAQTRNLVDISRRVIAGHAWKRVRIAWNVTAISLRGLGRSEQAINWRKYRYLLEDSVSWRCHPRDFPSASSLSLNLELMGLGNPCWSRP